MKCIEKKLDGNYQWMLQAVLIKSGSNTLNIAVVSSLPSHLKKTIQVKRTKHAGHSKGSKFQLKSNTFPWSPTHGLDSLGWPATTYVSSVQTLNGVWGLADNDWWRDGWEERQRERERQRDWQTDRNQENPFCLRELMMMLLMITWCTSILNITNYFFFWSIKFTQN